MPSATPSSEPSSTPTSSPSDIPSPCTCDDGNLCTVDFCDTDTNSCKYEPVACGQGQACDAFTGLCQDMQKVVPCVAVIDEWDRRDYSAKWAQFRSLYPQRPFCLLVPLNACGSAGTSVVSYLPKSFVGDDVNNPDGIDRTTVVTVTRDGQYGCSDASTSDWFSECGLDILSPASITFLGLFIDTSGSMTLSTVKPAYDKFLLKIENANIEYGKSGV